MKVKDIPKITIETNFDFEVTGTIHAFGYVDEEGDINLLNLKISIKRTLHV